MKARKNITRLLTGYIDGEISAEERAEVERAVQQDPKLAAELESETKIKSVLREQLEVVKAPTHLRQRIRRDILRADEKPSFSELLSSFFEYRPLATSLAFAVLAILVLVPSYEVVTSRAPGLLQLTGGAANTFSTEGTLEGEIICLDCELFSAGMRSHDVELHRPGLRATDGSIWTIVQKRPEDKMRYGRDLLQKKARLSGLIFPNSRYISVKGYQLL